MLVFGGAYHRVNLSPTGLLIVNVRALLCGWLRWIVIGVLAVSMTGCEREQSEGMTAPPATAAAANAAWPRFVNDFIEDYFVANPTFAVQAGRHEFDGKLPNWSAHGIEAEIRRLEDLRRRAETFDDAALLPEHRFQRDYLISVIDEDLFWLREARLPFKNPAYYFDHGLDPNTYIAVPYAPPEQRLKAFIAYLRAIPMRSRRFARRWKRRCRSPSSSIRSQALAGCRVLSWRCDRGLRRCERRVSAR